MTTPAVPPEVTVIPAPDEKGARWYDGLGLYLIVMIITVVLGLLTR
jgi:hypothetical protein